MISVQTRESKKSTSTWTGFEVGLWTMPPGLLHFIRRAITTAMTLSPIGAPIVHPVGCMGPMGRGLLRLIWDEFYHHAPQNTAPGYVGFGIALAVPICCVSLALAAHEAHRLAVPIVHEVKRNAARQIQRQRRRELEKAVAKVGRDYVLMRHKRQ